MGEVDSAQTQTQATDNAEKRKEALTKEATARSLLITLRKLQSLKEDRSNLQLQVSAVQQQLQEAEAALAASTEKHAALALEMKAVQETAEALRYASKERRHCLMMLGVACIPAIWQVYNMVECSVACADIVSNLSTHLAKRRIATSQSMGHCCLYERRCKTSMRWICIDAYVDCHPLPNWPLVICSTA